MRARAAGLLAALLLAQTLAWLAAGGPSLARPRPDARQEARQEPRTDPSYALGRGGWAVERFGGGVAVLRAGVTPLSEQGGGAGLLVLSCEGPERRLTLTLPEPLPEPLRDIGPDPRPVRLLLRRSPPVPGDFLVARARLTGGRSLALAAGEGGRVPALARMLRAAPARLDLLVGAGTPGAGILFPGPSSAPALAVLHPAVGLGDLPAFDDFLRACGEGS